MASRFQVISDLLSNLLKQFNFHLMNNIYLNSCSNFQKYMHLNIQFSFLKDNNNLPSEKEIFI